MRLAHPSVRVAILPACVLAGLAALHGVSAQALRAQAARAQPGAASLEVTHAARSLQPGELVVVRVVAPDSSTAVTGRAFDTSVPFHRSGAPGTWQGLVGIDLDVEPGIAPVMVQATMRDGTTLRARHDLDVAPKSFPTRRLTVSEDYVNPPAGVIERIQREARLVSGIFATVTEKRLWAGPFRQPVPGAATSSFGKRSILNGQPRSPHSGTDFRGDAGTPVAAPNAGRVVLADDLYFSGNVVIIDHGHGLYSYFAHLSRIDVAKGDVVEPGDVLGAVGATGRVTGPHLHWTVRVNGARVDALSLMEMLADEAS